MLGNVLIGVQLLFFGMGALYFFRNSKRRTKTSTFSADDNEKELEKIRLMQDNSLTEPLSEQTRPRNLGDIVGQEKAIKALRAALCSPNPQHILIYGPPGVGKTAAARLILEEAKDMEHSPFQEDAKFVEIDATTLQFDERNIADPLMGSVHDPIYQGAGSFGNAGIPKPRAGAVCEANGGVLFIDEIGELHPVQMNKLLKVLEDRIARFQSSYYSESSTTTPEYIHEIFKNGLPADFRLIGATTRNPSDISPALRSRCTEIFFDGLDCHAVEKIAENSLCRTGLAYDEKLSAEIATYARGGRDTVNLVQSMTALALMEGGRKITLSDLDWVVETGRYQPILRRKVSENAQVGVVNGLAVQGAGGGFLLLVEATVKRCESGGGLTVTGIVEEEEFVTRQHTSRRKSNARSSAENVLTLLEDFGLEKDKCKVHINFPGGTPVDGPSAGVAMFVAVFSAFLQVKVDAQIAMTGEIGLQGQILPVGGVTDKIVAAKEAGATCVYIPKENWRENYATMGIEVVPLSHIKELIQLVFYADMYKKITQKESVLTAKEANIS